ncbi:hypothetical protein LDENG_00265670 [Lucifuga dentata]|nr:hypothetical protein LDENG_00265670 [Lucifuga dentata]
MLLVSSWLVVLTLTSPRPLSFRRLYSLRLLDFVYCEEFSCSDISGLYLLLWPTYYSSWVSDNWYTHVLMAWILFLPLSWLPRTCLTVLEVLVCS